MAQLNFIPFFLPRSKNISVLLPTRGRTEMLKKSVMSLVNTASNPAGLEILFGFDNDDEDTLAWVNENILPELQQQQVDCKIVQFNRMGYGRLNEYVNGLARYALGKWLFFWNDDAWMKSSAWDDEIIKFDGKFRVLRMPTHNEHPYAIFPIIPVEWYRLFGYLSQHQLNDAWISQIGYMVNIVENIPVECVHDRADLTGNNNDDTFKEGAIHQAYEGNPSDPRDFNHSVYVHKRYEDADRIAWYLNMQGENVQWWVDVLAGQQNPWAYMLGPEQDPNNQVGQHK